MKKIDRINIWELQANVTVKFQTDFLIHIRKLILTNHKTLKQFWKLNFFHYNYSFYKQQFLIKSYFSKNLKFFVRLCQILEVNLKILQDSIVSYRIKSGLNKIKNPTLPIKISPVFDMVLAHHIGDGTVINSKEGRLPYFGYRQFDKFYRISYVKKLESLFGKICYKTNYFESSTRPYCPAVLSSLFFQYYNLNKRDFLSYRARIPKLLLEKNWKHKLAFLLGIIIDDGHVDSTLIVIGLKNPKLVQDLKNLCNSLGYPSTVSIKKRKEDGIYGFLSILKKGMHKLWQDYLLLKREYSVIDLGYKGRQIESNFKIHSRKIKNTKGNRKLILNLIKTKNYTVNEIAKEINMTRQGVRYHIHILLKSGKIKITGTKGENNYVYSV